VRTDLKIGTRKYNDRGKHGVVDIEEIPDPD
jgi:hypothetical protein